MENASYFMGKDGFNWFVGVVEDRQDPEHCSRVRVRALGYHTENTSKIPTSDLPWAHVMMPVTAGGNSGIGVSPHFLLEGTWVLGFFRDPAMQEPIILGTLPGKNTGSPSEFTEIASSEAGGFSKGGGFKDPNSKYPTSSYVNMADTNLLAQNDPSDTSSGWDFSKFTQAHASYAIKGGSKKDDAVHTKWKYLVGKSLTETELQEEPSTQDQSAYPFNHVFESESGHYVEFDDTEGNERIQIFHRLGTFIEIDKGGNVVLKTPDHVNMTTIIGGNQDTYIKGNYSLTVDGNINIHCTGEETRDGAKSAVGTDPLGTVSYVISKGNLYETITEGNRETTITAGTETVTIEGAVTHTYNNTLTETITGAVAQTYSDTWTQDVTKAVTQTFGDAWTIDVTKDVAQTFGAALKTEITGATNIESTGALTIKTSAALTAEASAATTIKGATVSFN